ncbi:hypothetical protein [Nitrosomonas halophila]|uniref:Uncharacterized protein n=1 Tax=Nitrosomonas halophila TaxID=44576 RepID=A0A1H3Q4F0_9PROT|nr:hypothetical protein [Nitrosomonas halophila]SDZ08246.1 hypothetical protein SAMN05421881_11313 [Nitrosomonas halophila]
MSNIPTSIPAILFESPMGFGDFVERLRLLVLPKLRDENFIVQQQLKKISDNLSKSIDPTP